MSPHGLGLTADQFWCLTMDEHRALVAQHDNAMWRWAFEQATLHNAHFLTKENDTPWVAGDFLGTEDRERRKGQKMVAIAESFAAKQRLKQQMASGDLSQIPAWALGHKRRRANGVVSPEEYTAEPVSG